MDLKALRTPTHTAHELALARASTQARTPRLVQKAARPERVIEPVARTELWRKYHAGAVRDGLPEPERFADVAVRAREAALRKKAERAKVVVCSEVPKPPIEAAVAKQAKVAPKSAGPRCEAKTLEGRQCGFAATCGPFCKKHAPKEPPPPAFKLVTEPRRFVDVRLKGYLNAPPALVAKVLGKPNGRADEKVATEWMLVFADGTPATLFFTRADPALHVCGEEVDVVARVRELLRL